MTVLTHGTSCADCRGDGPPDQPPTGRTWTSNTPRPRTITCPGCGHTGHSNPWCTQTPKEDK